MSMSISTINITPADLPVCWTGIAEHTTQRGKVRAILTGIPNQQFWYHRKHHAGFREQLRAATITLRRIAKGQWQVELWINRRNAGLVEALGYAVPEVASAASDNQPF